MRRATASFKARSSAVPSWSSSPERSLNESVEPSTVTLPIGHDIHGQRVRECAVVFRRGDVRDRGESPIDVASAEREQARALEWAQRALDLCCDRGRSTVYRDGPDREDRGLAGTEIEKRCAAGESD